VVVKLALSILRTRQLEGNVYTKDIGCTLVAFPICNQGVDFCYQVQQKSTVIYRSVHVQYTVKIPSQASFILHLERHQPESGQNY
jgi:hypothetical protein